MDLINVMQKQAKEYFRTSRGSHDWDHTERVMKLAVHLAEKEHANIEVVTISAILHDIGRDAQDKSNGKICHAEESARLAREILSNYPLSSEIFNNIIHCIESHRFRNAHEPQTIEAKVLYDADKLDSIGAVGIGRAFLFAGEIGARMHNKDIDLENTKAYTKDDTAYREFLVKLSKIKNRMLTSEGKKIAMGRDQFMREFFKRINLEVDGLI